ncbi:zinc finger and BTB domain-containing protein 5 [Grus japonensis]|uniref:Zinc finger and BTB domain-containing protein 5 n=1 Tax=Grus japonensis TaxID=30415 RepID=A0ABC9WUN2_GRUJA
MPAGSKTDLPLAKAELMSDGTSSSVITYLRKGKNHCATAAGSERNHYVYTKVREDEGGGDAPGTMVKTMVMQIAACGGPQRSRYPPCTPWRTPYQGRWMCPEGRCDPMESLHWSRFSGRTCDPTQYPHWSSLFLKDCTPWKGPALVQLMKNCSLWEGPTLEKFIKDCLLWEGLHTGAVLGGRSGRDEA